MEMSHGLSPSDGKGAPVVSTDGARQPATDDPFWIPTLSVPGRLTVEAAREAAASGVTTKAIGSTLQTGWRTIRDGGKTAVFSKGYSSNRVHVYVDADSGQMFGVYRGGNPLDWDPNKNRSESPPV